MIQGPRFRGWAKRSRPAADGDRVIYYGGKYWNGSGWGSFKQAVLYPSKKAAWRVVDEEIDPDGENENILVCAV